MHPSPVSCQATPGASSFDQRRSFRQSWQATLALDLSGRKNEGKLYDCTVGGRTFAHPSVSRIIGISGFNCLAAYRTHSS